MSKSSSKTPADFFRTSPSEHLQMLKQDIVYALRLMTKNPGFTGIILLTLALGVGANTAIFSLVRGVMLRPLPYNHGEQIIIIRQQQQKEKIPNLNFSVPEIADYRQQSDTVSSIVEYHTMNFTLLGHGKSDRVKTGVVSWNFFDFFGVKPILGRNFLPAEDQQGAAPVILLSYEYWQRNQHGDPDIVGKNFAMNDKVHTVVGVLPPIPQYPDQNDVYMTTSSCPFRSANIEDRDAFHIMRLFGRLKPNVTLTQADSDLSLVASRLAREYPESYPAESGYTAYALSLKDELTSRARPTLWVLLGAAGFVLLIACANVANFTLARMSQREQEIAVRTALGAARGRLLRQLFTESVVIGLFSAGLGLLLAIVSHSLLVQFVARLTPRAGEITIDSSVLLFALGIAVLTSVITGSTIAFSSRRQMVSNLKESSRGSTTGTKPKRVRNFLIVAQVAFALILLVGAGLMLRSFLELQKVDLGFVPERVLTMAIDLNWSKYDVPQKQLLATHTILNKVQSLPGVVSVAVSSSFPLDPDSVAIGPNGFKEGFQVEGKLTREGERRSASVTRLVSIDYFKTLGIPVIHGRVFQATDTMQAPRVAIISQSLAQHLFGSENPVGKRLSGDGGRNWLPIIGVVGSTKEFGLNEDPVDELYGAIEQAPRPSSLLVRTADDPETLIPAVRRAMIDFDPDTAIANVETMEAARHDVLASPRVMTDLLGIFAGLALVIAASGIGGMLALTVNQRIKEIGIRMALGAQPSDVRALIIKQGMLFVVIGLACGLGIAMALTGSLKSLLFKVTPTDPWTVVSVCVLLALTALGACYIPARRATRVDPLNALRHE